MSKIVRSIDLGYRNCKFVERADGHRFKRRETETLIERGVDDN